MKKIQLLLLLLVAATVSAQFNTDAPWMQELLASRNSEDLTLQEISDAFNAYWETRDPDAKGSGYKPFKRWENHMEFSVGPDGRLPNYQQLWQSWYASAQARSAMADESNWTAVGPFTHTNTGSWSSGQGRVNVIAVDPGSPNTYYIGAPAGGIWKSTDSGVNWTPLSDNLPQIGVSGIAIDPNDSKIIYIATGDDDGGNTDSVGVFKSIDGGDTWNATGLDPTNSPSSMNDIYIHPTDSDILWVATNLGVYKTTDAGANWTQTQSGIINDIKIKPGDPSVVYAVTSTRFYKSTNGGDSFTQISAGLPASSNRLVIDVTPANPNYVYAVSANGSWGFQGIYRYDESSGDFFTRTTNPTFTTNIFESTQAWFDLALGVSDTNADELYVGCLNVWKSGDGGSTFSKLNNWNAPSAAAYTHADIHMLRFFNGDLFCGSDGGIYRSSNGGTNFTDLTGTAAIGQFYKIAVSQNNSQKMVGGLQDNGGHALNNGQWQNYYGADGMDTAIDPNNDNLYYGFTQNGGSLNISSTAGGSLNSQVGAPAGTSGNWITPLVMNQDGELYSGYTNLYRLDGGSWTNVGSIGSRIDYLEVDPHNADNMYIAVNNNLRRSTNRGVNFSSIYSFSSNINSIEVNNTDGSIIYVTTAGTSGGGVFRSTDGGSTFLDITYDLPDETKYIVVHQGRNSEDPVYVGTSTGVYRLAGRFATWEPFMVGLPNVPIRDLEINLDDENITAATYGRGIWQSSIPIEVPPNDVRLISLDNPTSTRINCGDITPEVTVENNGSNEITTIDVVYTLDGVANNFQWTGSLAADATTTISLPVISPDRGAHTFSVSTTIANDAYPSNNSLSDIDFYANDTGVGQIINDFEQAEDELIAYNEGGGSLWERGIPSGAVLGAAAADGNGYATNLTGNHPNQTIAYLVSQCYDISRLVDPVLKFDMAFELELDWDYLTMEYSLDQGQTWNILGSAADPNWFNSSTTPGTNCFNCPGAQWTGTAATQTKYEYDLSAFSAETSMIFRFKFQSDQNTVEEGAVIDNFQIDATSVLSAVSFESNDGISVYPNPSDQIFNIHWINGSDVTINVYDITGKQIVNVNTDSSRDTYELNMGQFASGIYILRLNVDDRQVTRKLVLR